MTTKKKRARRIKHPTQAEPIAREGVPGTLYPPDTLFLRVGLGSARAHDTGNHYELATNADEKPLIRSSKSGWWCVFTWDELVTLAIRAGIDDPKREPGPSIDYRELLKKYIAWMHACEGVDYVETGTYYHEEEQFGKHEWAELRKLVAEVQGKSDG